MNLRQELACSVMMAVIASGLAHGSEEHVVHPARFAAPSGNHVWEIDPTDRNGRGPAGYVHKSEGRIIWSGQLPFTLEEAVVTTDGRIAGHAYTNGLDGFGLDAADRSYGAILILLVDQNGQVLLKDAVPRPDAYMHMRPQPVCSGVVVHEAQDMLIARLRHLGSETWQSYSLSHPRTPAARVSERNSHRYDSVIPVSGTPLLLTHEARLGDAGHSPTSRFELLDENWNNVWSLQLEHEFESIDLSNDVWASLRFLLARRFIASGTSNRFDVVSQAQDKVIHFAIARSPREPAGAGWQVSELGRSPDPFHQPEFQRRDFIQSPSTSLVPEKLATRNLRPLGEFSFGTPSSKDTLGIHTFEFDDHGNIGLLDLTPGESPRFLLMTQAGGRLAEVVLDPGLSQASSLVGGLVWLEEDRWLVYASREDPAKPGLTCWWVEPRANRAERTPSLGPGHPDHACRWVDGGFAILISSTESFTPHARLTVFNRQAQPVWSQTSTDERSRHGQDLLAMSGMCLTVSNQIAVADQTGVWLFDVNGKLAGRWRFSERWGREPLYIARVRGSRTGRLLFEDFRAPGDCQLVHTRADGTVVALIEPRYAPGVPFALRTAAPTPEGSELWATDGRGLFRLATNGTATVALGESPRADRLRDIESVTVDRTGNLYAIEQHTGTLHVFDPQGRPRWSLPNPRGASRPWIESVAHGMTDGGVLYSLNTSPGLLRIAANGSSATPVNLTVDSTTQIAHPLGTPNRMVIQGYQAAYICDLDGHVIKPIRRHADGRWFSHIEALRVLADGRIAIASPQWDLDSASSVVTLYTDGGDPISDLQFRSLPVGVSLDGTDRFLVAKDADGFTWHDALKGQYFHCSIPHPPEDIPRAFITRLGKEFWVVNGTSHRVERYAMPE